MLKFLSGLLKRKPTPVTSDPIAQFCDERLVRMPGSVVAGSAVYEDFCSWCAHRDIEPLFFREFVPALKAAGVQVERIAGRTRLIGMSLAS